MHSIYLAKNSPEWLTWRWEDSSCNAFIIATFYSRIMQYRNISLMDLDKRVLYEFWILMMVVNVNATTSTHLSTYLTEMENSPGKFSLFRTRNEPSLCTKSFFSSFSSSMSSACCRVMRPTNHLASHDTALQTYKINGHAAHSSASRRRFSAHNNTYGSEREIR